MGSLKDSDSESKRLTALGDVVKVDPNKRLIDMTASEVDELIAARLEEFLEGQPATAANDALLDRAGAAKYLAISIAKLDMLCRGDDPPPYVRIGDVKRFDRGELKAWALAHREVSR